MIGPRKKVHPMLRIDGLRLRPGQESAAILPMAAAVLGIEPGEIHPPPDHRRPGRGGLPPIFCPGLRQA